jgi:hypothetical protein
MHRLSTVWSQVNNVTCVWCVWGGEGVRGEGVCGVLGSMRERKIIVSVCVCWYQPIKALGM